MSKEPADSVFHVLEVVEATHLTYHFVNGNLRPYAVTLSLENSVWVLRVRGQVQGRFFTTLAAFKTTQLKLPNEAKPSSVRKVNVVTQDLLEYFE